VSKAYINNLYLVRFVVREDIAKNVSSVGCGRGSKFKALKTPPFEGIQINRVLLERQQDTKGFTKYGTTNFFHNVLLTSKTSIV